MYCTSLISWVDSASPVFVQCHNSYKGYSVQLMVQFDPLASKQFLGYKHKEWLFWFPLRLHLWSALRQKLHHLTLCRLPTYWISRLELFTVPPTHQQVARYYQIPVSHTVFPQTGVSLSHSCWHFVKQDKVCWCPQGVFAFRTGVCHPFQFCKLSKIATVA